MFVVRGACGAVGVCAETGVRERGERVRREPEPGKTGNKVKPL